MTDQMRFSVCLDKQWRGAVTCHQDGIFREQALQLEELVDTASGTRFPALGLALHDPDDDHNQLSGAAATAQGIQDLYDRVLGRGATQDEIRSFGHYLFDALIGQKRWVKMVELAEDHGAKAIELALCFDADDYDLNRINWELLHSKGGFLAASGPPTVAITRIVTRPREAPDEGEAPKPQEPPKPIDVPPRVLFVVGTALTEEIIRPGAELYSLLRQARDGRAMRYRLLEQASPTRIKGAITEFHPEIVHIICHGGSDDDKRVFLNLENDEQDVGPERYADQLALDLSDGDWRPTIVVLSACLTAGTAADPHYVLAGAHESAPFAAELVKEGIPIVIGMAGHVADITSRVFARKFGESVIHGKPLVLATAQARKVAIAGTPGGKATANWALPAVFMAESVPPGYTPVDVTSSDELWRQIETWIEGAGLPEQPVFCGRSDVLAMFPRLFENPGANPGAPNSRKRVLAILVENQTPGYGRSRLLKEMAAEAFRDGHLPVLLQFEAEDAPRNHRQLVSELDLAISRLRVEVLGIGDAEASQLYFLDSGEHAKLAPLIQRALRNNELTEEALRRALQADLATLLDDARRAIPFLKEANGQVVVLLDDVDQYGELTARFFASKNGLLRPMGFGTTTEPVPVVMTCSRVRESDTESPVLRLYEKPWSINWLAVYKLGRFQSNGEDLLACQAVLLNPFAHEMLPQVSDVPWAFNGDVDAAIRKRYEGMFRKALGGMPCRFETGRFYGVAGPARKDDFLVEADDDTRLAGLPEAV
jgi:hypothetical protein